MREQFNNLKDGQRFIFAGVRYIKVNECLFYNAVELYNSKRGTTFAGTEIVIIMAVD